MSVLDECARLQSQYEKTDEFLDKNTMITHRNLRDLKQEIQSLKKMVIEARANFEKLKVMVENKTIGIRADFSGNIIFGEFVLSVEEWLEKTKDIKVD